MPLGDLVTNFSANTQGLDKGIAKSKSGLQSFAASAQTSLKSVVVSIGAMATAWASVRGVMSAVEAAFAQSKAEKKLESVFKSTGHAAGLSSEQIKKYASELQNITNYGDEATINTAALLATFTSIKGDVFKEALGTIQDMSAVMDTDLKGSAIQLGKALNNPIAGVSALSDVGVSFTAEQKNMIRALQETGDLMGAQRIILNELKVEFGDAAKNLVNPFTQLSNKLGDVQEQFGIIAIDIAKEFLPAAMDVLDWVENLGKGFNELGGDKWTWLGDTLVAAFDVAFESIKVNWSTMLSDMIESLDGAFIDRVQWELNPKNWFNAAEPPPAWLGGAQQRGGGLEGAQARLAAQMAQINGNNPAAGKYDESKQKELVANLWKQVEQSKKTSGEGSQQYKDAALNWHRERTVLNQNKFVGPKMQQAKGSGDFAGLFGKIADAAAMPIAGIKQVAMQKFEGAKNTLGFIGDLAKTAFGGETATAEKAKALEPRLAGASVKGSAEAYSTIVQSMLRGGKDPVVTATEKQTKDLIKGLKPLPPAFNFVAAFLP